MIRSSAVFVCVLLAASYALANSVTLESPSAHPTLAVQTHLESLSSPASHSWEISKNEKGFDNWDDHGINAFHGTEKAICDPAVSAVPEVPTGWLLLFGTVALFGSSRLKAFYRRAPSLSSE